jgi:hypothetical protein
MHGAKLQFEILSPAGFCAIARVTEDDRLLLAPGITPDDLPGRLGSRVRQRLSRGELAVAAMEPTAAV